MTQPAAKFKVIVASIAHSISFLTYNNQIINNGIEITPQSFDAMYFKNEYCTICDLES